MFLPIILVLVYNFFGNCKPYRESHPIPLLAVQPYGEGACVKELWCIVVILVSYINFSFPDQF